MTDDLHSQAYLYVVGALEPEDVVEFEAHLADCADCQQEVADLREVTAELSEMVAAEPPPGLRASLMAEIAQTRQEPPAPSVVSTETAPRAGGRHAAPVPTHAAAEPKPAAGESGEPSQVVPIRRSWASRASIAVAAAAVVAAAAIGGWAINERNDARHDADVASEQAAEAADLARVLAAKDSQKATAVVAGGGTATVVRSDEQGQAFLVATDLPDLASGKVYEAWTIGDDETPVPAGMFESDTGPVTVELTRAALDAGAVALSVEPTGGSDQPTTTPIVAVPLSNKG
jgi:anti-sigma-K factor RskA